MTEFGNATSWPFIADSNVVFALLTSGGASSSSLVRATPALDSLARDRVRQACLLSGIGDRGHGLEVLQRGGSIELAERGSCRLGASALVRSVRCLRQPERDCRQKLDRRSAYILANAKTT